MRTNHAQVISPPKHGQQYDEHVSRIGDHIDREQVCAVAEIWFVPFGRTERSDLQDSDAEEAEHDDGEEKLEHTAPHALHDAVLLATVQFVLVPLHLVVLRIERRHCLHSRYRLLSNRARLRINGHFFARRCAHSLNIDSEDN
jgi:hypothetical protein